MLINSKVEEIEELLNSNLDKTKIIEKKHNVSIDLRNRLENLVSSVKNPLQNNIARLKVTEKNVELTCGQEIRLLLFQSLVFRLYLKNYCEIEKQNLPHNVITYIKEDFSRILDLAMKGSDKFLTFEEYQFQNYIEIMNFNRFPLGNHNISISGIPRRLIIRQSFLKQLSLLGLLIKMGGNSPLFELHYNPHRFREFNEKGWEKVFQLAGEMLMSYPNIKGVFGATWFYDPTIKEISPELYYIRELIEGIGGTFFIVGSSEEDKKNALFMSKTRKVAFEEELYMPTSYMAVIRRPSLLKYIS